MAAAVWLVTALVLVGIEVVTVALVAAYPAFGALVAAAAALLGAPVGIQIAVFAVVSVATLLLTRRPLQLMRNTPIVPSNAPTVIGKRAVVVVAIEEGPGQRGQVRVGTEHWSARSEDERPVDEGTTVEVSRIDGVALVVRPVRDTTTREG